MAVTFDITPQLALMRGLDRFRIRWLNIANAGASADSQSLDSGAQNYSIAGIAISPDSIWTRLTVRSLNGFGSSQTVTHETPYIGDIPAPWDMLVETEGQYVDSYYPIGSGTASATFNQGMGNDPAGIPIWGGATLGQFPFADLIVYLRPPASVHRADQHLFSQGGAFDVAAGTNVVRVLAVPNRKRLRADFKNAGTGQYTVTITGASGGGPNVREFAFPGGASAAVAAAQQATIEIDPLVDVVWIFITMTLDAGDPIAIYSLVAE